MTLRVGFTGTREGMTVRQYLALSDWFLRPRNGRPEVVPSEVHHGCCVGADAEFVICVIRGRIGSCEERSWAEIHAHPSDIPGMTDDDAAACSECHPAKDSLVRNRDIVAACDVLVACPDGPERVRSGTWSTVRWARRCGKRVVVIMPDGKVEES